MEKDTYIRLLAGEREEYSVLDHPEELLGEKAGGAYVTVTGRIKKIDLYDRILLMEDGTGIPMKDVVELEGEIFSDLDR